MTSPVWFYYGMFMTLFFAAAVLALHLALRKIDRLEIEIIKLEWSKEE
jgi:hypothetical protein